MIVWLTGLPSSGKSTLAYALKDVLQKIGHKIVVLDGDEIRRTFWPELGFSKEDRDANVLRLGHLARLFSGYGISVVVAAVSPYREARQGVRALVSGFVEVYVRCPVETCIQRNVKGLYEKALAGELRGLTGIDAPYEPPLNAEVVVDTDGASVDSCVQEIVSALRRLGYLL